MQWTCPCVGRSYRVKMVKEVVTPFVCGKIFDRETTHVLKARILYQCVPPPPPRRVNPSSSRKQKPQPQRVRIPGFKGAKLWISPPGKTTEAGPCPRTLTFQSAITYDSGASKRPSRGRAALLQFRYRLHDGRTSPLLKTTFKGLQKKTLQYWKATFPSPNRGNTSLLGRLNGPSPQLRAKPGTGRPPKVKGWVALELVHTSRTSGVQYKPLERVKFSFQCLPQRVSPTPQSR